MFFLILFSSFPKIYPFFTEGLTSASPLRWPFSASFSFFFSLNAPYYYCVVGQRATFRSQFSPSPYVGSRDCTQAIRLVQPALCPLSSLDLDVILLSSWLSFSHVVVFFGGRCNSFFSLFKLPLFRDPFPVPYPTDSSCVFLYRTLTKAMALLAPYWIVTVGG